MIKTLGISLAVATVLSMSGCGSSSTNNNDTTPPPSGKDIIISKSYNGAGSRWDLNFKSDKTATIKELNSNLEINATYEELSSGFRKITTVSSSDSTIANGTVTYGFELPDYMFSFVAFNENKLIPSIRKSNECPTDGIKHNYITSFAQSKDNGDFNGFALYGYLQDDIAQNSFTYKSFDSSNNVASSGVATGYTMKSSCANGSYYAVGSTEVETSFFTNTGGFIAQKYDTQNHELRNQFGVPYESNLNTINQIDGNYIGYVISGNGQSNIGYTNTPVSVVATNGRLIVKDINVTSGIVGNKISDVSLTTEVTGTKGLWSGQITTVSPSGTDGIGCAIDLNAGGSGKNVVICAGMLPDGTSKKLYSLILVNK